MATVLPDFGLLSFDLLCKTLSGSLFLPLSLLWILVLRLPCSICRKSINQRDDNLFYIDFRVKLSSCREERSESMQVELVGEDLIGCD